MFNWFFQHLKTYYEVINIAKKPHFLGKQRYHVGNKTCKRLELFTQKSEHAEIFSTFLLLSTKPHDLYFP